MVFHGNGGYDWETLYNMPIWLRKFTYNKIREFYEKQNEEAEKQKGQLKNNNSKEMFRPNITPTYSTKATKK
jgi:hypothetical protein